MIKEKMSVWGFVEKYLIKYSSSQLVADANDLEVIIEGEAEEDSCAYKKLQRDYKGNLKHRRIQVDYDYTHRRVYEEAIECFIAERKPEGIESVWDFVVKYYPDYDHADMIAHAGDYHKLVNNEFEEDSCAADLLRDEYGGNLNHPGIKANYEYMHRRVYEDSIEGFLDVQEEIAKKV